MLAVAVPDRLPAVALTCCGVLILPSVQSGVFATPLMSVVTTRGPVRKPSPATTRKVTGILGTPLPNLSATLNETACVSCVPANAVWLLPLTTLRTLGAPGAPVAVNVIGWRPDTVTVSMLVPARVPRVQIPTDVGPAALVVGAPVIVPPPLVTAIDTATLPSALPLASATTKVGDAASAAPAVAPSVAYEPAVILAGLGGAVESPFEHANSAARMPASPAVRSRKRISEWVSRSPAAK